MSDLVIGTQNNSRKKIRGFQKERIVEQDSGTKQEPEVTTGNKLKESSLYDVLGISETATPSEIKAQFLKLSLIYHPDKETGNPMKFKSIMLAYKVLSSKKKRSVYDKSLSNTWDELKKDIERDTNYHVTTEHMKSGKDGINNEVDTDSFNTAFMSKRNDGDAIFINQILKEKTNLGTDNPLFGRVTAISTEESENIIKRRMLERDAEDHLVPETDHEAFDNLRDNFDSNLFNKIFNNLQSKKQELTNYDEKNEDEFLISNDPIFGSGQSTTSEWSDTKITMFGNSSDSNMGGLGSLGSLKKQDLSDENLITSLDLQTLLDMAKKERNQNYNISYTRDTRANAEALQIDEYKKRIEEMVNERERLLNSTEFIIRTSMIDNSLDDPSLFDDSMLTIDPSKPES